MQNGKLARAPKTAMVALSAPLTMSPRSIAPRFLAALILTAFAAVGAWSAETPREQAIKIVTQIKRADYEGDRTALKRLYGELSPFADDKDKAFASRVLYWRGFALWRRSINGFNDSVDPKELEQDLMQAVDEFNRVTTVDPSFTDAKVGTVSCLGFAMFLNQKNQSRAQELYAQSSPLLKEVRAAAPDNPRMLWVLGPVLWWVPVERGGGQDKAIEAYEKGLALARAQKTQASDSLEPSWGEPELLMSLAWSNLNRAKPDLDAAEKDARSALELVPYWHYVRDILMQQIRDAKAKHS
jgi:tetratricopeptide (TPR) repeat protein